MREDLGQIEKVRVMSIRIQAADPKFVSSGESVGDGERQRAVAVRNRRNFLQVESKDLC